MLNNTLKALVLNKNVCTKSVSASTKQSLRTKKTYKRAYHTSLLRLSGLGGLNQHVNTEQNHTDMSFDFTPENWQEAKKIIKKYPSQYLASATGPLLDLAQRQCGGWLPVSAMNKVASIVEVPPLAVYEVATFYSMFNRYPIGKHLIHVCGTTPCHTLGMPSIKEAILKKLGTKPGVMTKDGKYTVIEVECLGACVNGPVIKVGDDYYEDATIETALRLIDDFEAGNPPPPGPLYKARRVAEPEGGKTTLLEEPMGPYAPYLDTLTKN